MVNQLPELHTLAVWCSTSAHFVFIVIALFLKPSESGHKIDLPYCLYVVNSFITLAAHVIEIS